MDDLLIIWEYGNNTNPLVKDTDGDGFSDGEEIRIGTDPLDPKSHPLEYLLSFRYDLLTFFITLEK